MHLKKEKKNLKTIEATKQKKKLASPNGLALSFPAERTGNWALFSKMAACGRFSMETS